MSVDEHRKTLGARVKDRLVDATWRPKWSWDRRRLPLLDAHRPLYECIHRFCFQSVRRYPNLVRPVDYTDKLQWLKLFDQHEAIVACSDKIRVKEHVAERAGAEYVPELLQAGARFEDLNVDELPDAFVLKTNHDSGTVIVVHDKRTLPELGARERLETALARTYGWEKGEWPYSLIAPRVFAEELLGEPFAAPPSDYKLHCVDGRVAWVQHIQDRQAVAKESLAERDGAPLPIRFSPYLAPGPPFRKPPRWEEMVELAEALAAGFKYVRVDLYAVAGRPYVGELTFFPLSGAYRGGGQRLLGQRLTFDREDPKPPIVADEGVRIEARAGAP